MIATIFVGCRVLASNYVVCIWLITPFRHMIYLKSGGNMDPDSVSRHHHLLKRGGFKGNADAKGVFWRWQHAYITERCCSCQAGRKDLFLFCSQVSNKTHRRSIDWSLSKSEELGGEGRQSFTATRWYVGMLIHFSLSWCLGEVATLIL